MQKKQQQQQQKKQFNPQDYERVGLPEEEIKEIKQAFDIFDQDGSGKIDPSELREAFEKLGFKGNKKFIYNILSELDNDFSGGIEFEEFLKISTAKISDKDSRKEVQKVFNMFDLKKMGRVSVNELKQIAIDLGEEMTDEDILKMFKKADLDDDGFVTVEDFYNIMTGRVYWDN